MMQVLPAAEDSMRPSVIAGPMQGQPGPRELLPNRHPQGHNQLDLQFPPLQPYQVHLAASTNNASIFGVPITGLLQSIGLGEGSQEGTLRHQQQLLHYEALKQAHLATQWLGRPDLPPSQTGLTPSLGSVNGASTQMGEVPTGLDATPQRVLPRLLGSTPSLKFWKQQQQQQQVGILRCRACSAAVRMLFWLCALGRLNCVCALCRLNCAAQGRVSG